MDRTFLVVYPEGEGIASRVVFINGLKAWCEDVVPNWRERAERLHVGGYFSSERFMVIRVPERAVSIYPDVMTIEVAPRSQ